MYYPHPLRAVCFRIFEVPDRSLSMGGNSSLHFCGRGAFGGPGSNIAGALMRSCGWLWWVREWEDYAAKMAAGADGGLRMELSGGSQQRVPPSPLRYRAAPALYMPRRPAPLRQMQNTGKQLQMPGPLQIRYWRITTVEKSTSLRWSSSSGKCPWPSGFHLPALLATGGGLCAANWLK